MRVGLTGASGLLGSAIMKVCTDRKIICGSISRDWIDFQHPSMIEKHLSDYDVIIHAAANTNVEGCEEDPEKCYKDNFLLSKILAVASARCGRKFVFISSTGVYGNSQEQAYTEYDSVHPTTHHHRAKRLSEEIALRGHDSLVIRTGWLFGGIPKNGKNFVARRIEEASLSNGIVYSNNEQRGNPSYVIDVAKCLIELIEDGQHGIFNCVNEGTASRMEYVSKIIQFANLPVQVKSVSANSFQRLAKVSNNETASNMRLRQCGYPAMPTWQDGLERYIRDELMSFIENFPSSNQ